MSILRLLPKILTKISVEHQIICPLKYVPVLLAKEYGNNHRRS